jgi:hypothetical protein
MESITYCVLFLYKYLPYTTGAYNTLYYGLYAGNLLYSSYKFINSIKPKPPRIETFLIESKDIDLSQYEIKTIDNRIKQKKNKNCNIGINYKNTEDKKYLKLIDKYTSKQISELYSYNNNDGDLNEFIELMPIKDDNGFVNCDYKFTTKEELVKLDNNEEKALRKDWCLIDFSF